MDACRGADRYLSPRWHLPACGSPSCSSRSRWPPTSVSGNPPSTCSAPARISLRLGERLGLDTTDLATLYDVSILTYVGCPVYGNEASTLFGNDIDFRAHTHEVDLAGFPAMVFMLRRAGSGTSAFNRARQAATLMATGGRSVVEQMANHCSAAGGAGPATRPRRRGAGRHRAVLRPLGRAGGARRPGRRCARAGRPHLAHRRSVRGDRAHGGGRAGGRGGPGQERHALRPPDRLGGPDRSGLALRRRRREHRRRDPRRGADRATTAHRRRARPHARGDRRLLRSAVPVLHRARPRHGRAGGHGGGTPERRGPTTSRSPAAPRSSTTSVASASPARCGTSRAR